MRTFARAGTAVLTTVIICGAATTAAHGAWVNKSGTKSCGTSQLGRTTAYSWGDTIHSPPGGSGVRTFSNSTWMTTRKSATTTRGGAWMVSANLGLNNPKTFASCVTGGA